jgi:hypothetical protein
MPNQRAPGQKQVLTMMKEEFLAEIDSATAKLGYSDRSALIRDAVYEKMERCGVKVPAQFKTAPPRTGKGGRKRVTQSQSQTTGPKKLHVSDVLPIVNHPPDLIPSPKFLAEKLARTKKHK